MRISLGENSYRLSFRYGYAVPDGPAHREFLKFREIPAIHVASSSFRANTWEGRSLGLLDPAAVHKLTEATIQLEGAPVDAPGTKQHGKPSLTVVAVASSYCSPLDKYSKENGRQKSLKRAIEILASGTPREKRKPIWDAFLEGYDTRFWAAGIRAEFNATRSDTK